MCKEAQPTCPIAAGTPPPYLGTGPGTTAGLIGSKIMWGDNRSFSSELYHFLVPFYAAVGKIVRFDRCTFVC